MPFSRIEGSSLNGSSRPTLLRKKNWGSKKVENSLHSGPKKALAPNSLQKYPILHLLNLKICNGYLKLAIHAYLSPEVLISCNFDEIEIKSRNIENCHFRQFSIFLFFFLHTRTVKFIVVLIEPFYYGGNRATGKNPIGYIYEINL